MTTTPDPIDVHVGAQVRQRRIAQRLSQTDLGTALGMTFQQVQKYEKGTNRIACSTLMRICGRLQCAPADLLPASADLTPADVAPTTRLAGLREGAELADLLVRMDATGRASILSIARMIVSGAALAEAAKAA